MKLKGYSFEKYTERYYYAFESVGPKGIIEKLVCFTLTDEWPERTFNLSFGDKRSDSFEFDDKVVTNNKDSAKILQTVALIVLEFLRIHRNTIISFSGGTPSRNRLYQMFMSKFWSDIDQYFLVYGSLNKKWYSFEFELRYDGFMFIYKKIF